VPALEGPKARTSTLNKEESERAKADDKLEAGTTSAAATDKKPTPQQGNGDKPLNPTQQKILRNSLERAALNELDLSTKFGVNIDGLKAADFNAVASWIADRAA
jgi:hypothetical protein